MSIVRDYLHDVLRRARVPMEPFDYEVDWVDQPRRHKVYPRTAMIPLPAPEDEGNESVAGGESDEGRPFAIGALSAMLANSYGITGRRLAIHTNEDVGGLPYYRTATWSRGTANGGGLYPLEVTLVSGPAADLTPGIYGYATAHHGLTRLATGDASTRIHAALAAAGYVSDADQYLVVSVKFWKNAFKYNTFSYHVVSMDVGALLGTWRLWARANGRAIQIFQWFDEDAVNDVIGVDGIGEGVFAVVALGPASTTSTLEETSTLKLRASNEESERSHSVRTFDRIELVHKETAAGATAPRGIPARGGAEVAHRGAPLAPPTVPTLTQSEAFRARRSSFGRFADNKPLAPGQLHAVLEAGSELLGVADEFLNEAPLTRLAVFVNHVDGIEPGSYWFDPPTGSLLPIELGPHGLLLQRSYFLQNYNLEQAAAVIVVTAKPFLVMDVAGDRGYRVVNAAVGSVAQQIYTTAASLGIGAGAALGFDNIGLLEALNGPQDAVSREVGIGPEVEWPMLIVAVGNERAAQADFRAVLYTADCGIGIGRTHD